MNKILLGSEDYLENLVFEEDTDLVIKFDNVDKNINIIIEDNVCLNLLELSTNTKNKITFILKENSRLLYNRALKNCNDVITIHLDGIASNANINNSCISNINSDNYFYINHNNSSTISNLSNHGINRSFDSLEFNVNVTINSCGKNVVTKQENKIINLSGGKSKILPNLIVDNDDVSASHSAYISDFDKDSMFYMNSRGINNIEAIKLLVKSFLFGNLENIDDYMDEINVVFDIY